MISIKLKNRIVSEQMYLVMKTNNLFRSMCRKFNDNLNLLLITENENKHYVLIKDFNRLMFNQTKHKERKHFCMHCLQCISSEDILTKHETECLVINGKQAIKMPEKGEKVINV